MDLTRYAPYIAIVGYLLVIAFFAIETGWPSALLVGGIGLVAVGINGLTSG